MSIKIAKKIVKYRVDKDEPGEGGDVSAAGEAAAAATAATAATTPATPAEAGAAPATGAAATAPSPSPEPVMSPPAGDRSATSGGGNVIQMHETVGRPDMLLGSTYKVKTPVSDHAMYVTINDIILNEGTPHEQRRPFEVFINSKNLDHYQWIVALTRVISAVFRKGGDVTFLVDELKAVFDPRGGYWKPGGVFMPSIIAELGYVIERHLQRIGLLRSVPMDERQRKLLEEKKAEFEALNAQPDLLADDLESTKFPEGAQLCQKCSTLAVVSIDNCLTCLNCGDSKCG